MLSADAGWRASRRRELRAVASEWPASATASPTETSDLNVAAPEWMPGSAAQPKRSVCASARGWASSDARPALPPRPACRFFARGACSKGAKCQFSHLVVPSDASSSTPILRAPCRFFAQGACNKGANCPFAHLAVSSDPCSSSAPVPRAPCRFFAQGACRKGADCPFSHELISVKVQQNEKQFVKDFVTATLEGVQCTFGSGMQVQEIAVGDGAAISRIAIHGLTPRITDADIVATLSEFGAACLVRKHETYAFATFDRAEHASAAVSGLNATSPARWARLQGSSSCRKDHCITVRLAAPPGVIVTQNASVKVLWYSPSRDAWAHFQRQSTAREAASRGNGKILHGRAISMTFQEPSLNQRTSFSVWIGGIGAGADRRDLVRLLQRHGGVAPSSIALNSPPFSEKEAGKLVERLLRSIGPLSAFEEAARPPGVIKCKALAKFARPGDAEEACQRLNNRKTDLLGGSKLFVQRVFSAKFILLNPVYAVVRDPLMALLTMLTAPEQGLRYKIFAGEASTAISLQADTPVAIAFSKGMLSPILSSKRISLAESGGSLWHASFAHPQMYLKLQKLNAALAGAALVFRDLRRRELHVWGEPEARQRASAAVHKLHEEIMGEHHALPLEPDEFVSALRKGLDVEELKRACGARSISLDLNARSLLVEGDADTAKRAIACLALRLADGGVLKASKDTLSAAEDSMCAVCYCPPEAPVKLVCSHEYCTSCLSNWMKATCSAGGGPGFPIRCLFDGCNCHVALADLHGALTRQEMQALQRAALEEHVNQNLDRLQFCINPGCGGIFSLAARTASCSACGACICTTCKVEEHEGLTCSQYLQAKAPPDRLRLRVVDEVLTLRCPRCSQAFLDFEGCFALKCSKCPCTFCGWCLADCGSDAHAHVRKCSAKPPGADTFFGSRQQFEEAQRKRQTLKLYEFLATLSGEERQRLLEALEADLRDLQIRLRCSLIVD